MYQFTLAAHNIMRWVVVLLAIYALVRIYMGLFGKKDWGEADRKALSYFAIGMDIQLLLGLLLYFVVSPLMASIRSNFGAAMSDSNLRFFAVEHLMLMLVALVLAHVAVVMARRATTSTAKFRQAAIWLTLSVLAVLVAIPWQRPLIPYIAMSLPFFG
jgi:heme A synthase